MQQSTLPPFEVGLGKLRECTFMGAMGCKWLGSSTGGAHSNQVKVTAMESGQHKYHFSVVINQE